jgi:Cft2 family RNA processing exonuclease
VPWLWVACWRHDIQEMQQMSMLMNSNNGSGQFTQSESALSEVEEMVPPVPLISMEISPPVETTVSVPVSESVETVETDPVAEREQIVSLLEEIDALIAAGGEDAETWQEIKILLEQTLVDMEDTINDPNEF